MVSLPRCSWATLWVQGRLILGEEAGEGFGPWGHSEVLGGWPFIDLVSRELDPPFHGLEHLDLEGGEEHGEVCSLWEWVSAVEVGAHEFDNGLVVFADVAFELVEGSEDVLA